MKSNSFEAFRTLRTEQARLVERGVRPTAIVGNLDSDDEAENRSVLMEAAQVACVLSFAFDRHINGYASHAWAIDLLRWSLAASQVQRNRIPGLLLGYDAKSIEIFEARSATVSQ